MCYTHRNNERDSQLRHPDFQLLGIVITVLNKKKNSNIQMLEAGLNINENWNSLKHYIYDSSDKQNFFAHVQNC